MLFNKINTQSEIKLNKTISCRSVLLSKIVCLQSLSGLPKLLGPYMVPYENQQRTSKKHNMYTINNAAWKTFYLVILLLSNWTLSVQSASTEPSGIRIDPDDGGYTGIVFEIKEEVPEESCAEILKNLKVRFFSIY